MRPLLLVGLIVHVRPLCSTIVPILVDVLVVVVIDQEVVITDRSSRTSNQSERSAVLSSLGGETS